MFFNVAFVSIFVEVLFVTQGTMSGFRLELIVIFKQMFLVNTYIIEF